LYNCITDNTSIYQYNITIITHEEWKSVLRVGVEMNRIWIRLSKKEENWLIINKELGKKTKSNGDLYEN
jgi:hypothetical protein